MAGELAVLDGPDKRALSACCIALDGPPGVIDSVLPARRRA